MIKKTLTVLFVLCCVLTINAQNQKADSLKTWKAGGNASVNFSQVSLTNWAGGGNNSVAGTFLFKGFLNHKKDKIAWDNSVELGYGLTKQEGYNVAKTEDKLNLNSKFGYSAGGNWFYSAMMDFKTQFAKGFKDPLKQNVKISDYMAPGYLLFSLGMDYKPSDNFSLFISPLTSKMTFVLNDSLSNVGAYGVEAGDNMRGEYGASVKVLAKKDDIIKNVNVYSRLELFSNYSENPQNIDVDFEFGFNMKINAYLNALFKTNILFDDDVKYTDNDGVEHGARIQTKQLFGAGLSIKF